MTLIIIADLFKENKDIYICEGEFDALVLIARGFAGVSSTGGAMAFKEEWVDEFRGKNVYACFDNDIAGVRGAIHLHYILPRAKIMSLPESVGAGGDITDFFIKLEKDDNDFLNLAHEAWDFLPFPDSNELRKDKKLLEDYKKYADAMLESQRTMRSKGNDNQLFSTFLDEYVKIIQQSKQKPKPVFTGNSDRLQMAKQTPITNYIKFNRAGFAPCIWHKEKEPSMKYSEDRNRVFCFGCSKTGDVLDVVQELNGIGLKEAINEVLK